MPRPGLTRDHLTSLHTAEIDIFSTGQPDKQEASTSEQLTAPRQLGPHEAAYSRKKAQPKLSKAYLVFFCNLSLNLEDNMSVHQHA